MKTSDTLETSLRQSVGSTTAWPDAESLGEELASLAPGHKKSLQCFSPFSLPLTVLRGTQPGKKLLLTAGVHGCEYCSIIAALELARELDPETMHGSVVILPVANLSGFYERLPALVAEDCKNLNRVFPGSADGSYSEKLALLVTRLQDWADFYVDMHGGDLHESMHPFVYVPGVASAEVTNTARQAASCLNVDVRVLSSATTGAYNSAAIRGTPSLLIERGGRGLWSREEVDAYKKDILALLHFLQILPGDAARAHSQRECANVIYLESEARGLWFPGEGIEPGRQVTTGQPLGEVRDFSNSLVQQCTAMLDGIVLYMTVSLAVKEGTPLVAYG